jgi:hypothetical protein
MEVNKKEVINLLDSVGNEPDAKNGQHPLDWLKDNNQFLDPVNPLSQKPKSGCKSGKCGNNTTGIIIFSILAALLMFAGYGLGKMVETIF